MLGWWGKIASLTNTPIWFSLIVLNKRWHTHISSHHPMVVGWEEWGGWIWGKCINNWGDDCNKISLPPPVWVCWWWSWVTLWVTLVIYAPCLCGEKRNLFLSSPVQLWIVPMRRRCCSPGSKCTFLVVSWVCGLHQLLSQVHLRSGDG